MTESKAIKKLKQHFEYLKHAWKPHPDYETMDAIGYAIQALEKQINGRWISVNERKPEKFEDVLVALSGKIRGGTCDGEYRDDICVGYYGYNRWHNHTNLYDCKVNYWMPLPKPYKESEE